MNMIVVESFLEGKSKDISKCEDGFIVTEDYAVMIDGASSKSKMDFGGKTSARYMMEKIKEIVLELEGDLGSKEFIDELSLRLREDYEKNGWLDLFEKEPKYRPTASMAVYSNYYRQVWLYSDCRARIGDKQVDNEKYIDEVTSTCRKLYLEGQLKKGRTVEELKNSGEGMDAIWKFLELQQYFQNSGVDSEFSYSAVDGWDFYEEHIKVVDVPREVDYVTLTTDGYNDIRENLEETEKVLQNQLKKDPLGINELKGFRSVSEDMNSVDDRAYIRFRP